MNSTIAKLKAWLNTGSRTQILIRRILVAAAAILIVYHAGYAIGKLIFHLGA